MCAYFSAYLPTHANHLPTHLPVHLPIEDKRMLIEPAMVSGVMEGGFGDE
jgi:hypothetical protein